VAGPADWREAQLRVDGWRSTLAHASARTPPLLQGDWSPRSGYAAGLQLADREDVTAVFTANDQMALGVIHALAQRGKRVPEDVSVVGFDDIPEAEFFLPGLTTIRQNFDEVGRLGLDLLVHILGDAGGEHHERPTIVPEFVLRASTAAP
jgi:LacI family transcriptional regulator